MNLTFCSRRELLRKSAKLGIAAAGGLTLRPLLQYLLNQEDELKSPLVVVNNKGEIGGSWRNIPDTRIWVKRDQAGIMALLATCSHLGCEVRYYPEKDQFLCPCHGSVYDGDGKVVSGPAGKNLPRVAVELKQDGAMIINTSKQVGNDARAT